MTSLDDTSLDDYRTVIDEIDDDLIRGLEKRDMVVGELCQYKAENGVGVVDEDREREVYEKIRRKAEILGLDPNYAESVFRLIIEHSRREQEHVRS